MVYDALQWVVEDGFRFDKKYSAENGFVFLHIFRAGKYIQSFAEERERQQQEERQAQELKKRKEREEAERQRQEAKRKQQEREEAERVRKQKQAEIAADRAKRLDEEMARLSGKPAQSTNQKAFAGYETNVPRKKSKLVRNIVIGVIILIVIIGILFLIPAPESLQ
jgi:archaellum component FlaD/FlaE